jgi:hypothetical protein
MVSLSRLESGTQFRCGCRTLVGIGPALSQSLHSVSILMRSRTTWAPSALMLLACRGARSDPEFRPSERSRSLTYSCGACWFPNFSNSRFSECILFVLPCRPHVATHCKPLETPEQHIKGQQHTHRQNKYFRGWRLFNESPKPTRNISLTMISLHNGFVFCVLTLMFTFSYCVTSPVHMGGLCIPVYIQCSVESFTSSSEYIMCEKCAGCGFAKSHRKPNDFLGMDFGSWQGCLC